MLNICNKAAGLGAAKLKVLNRCFADIGLHKKEFELKKNKNNNSSSYVKLTFLGTEALKFLADYKGGLAINYILDTCFPEAEHKEFVHRNKILWGKWAGVVKAMREPDSSFILGQGGAQWFAEICRDCAFRHACVYGLKESKAFYLRFPLERCGDLQAALLPMRLTMGTLMNDGFENHHLLSRLVFKHSLRGGGTVNALERETFNKILMKNLQIIQYGADYIEMGAMSRNEEDKLIYQANLKRVKEEEYQKVDALSGNMQGIFEFFTTVRKQPCLYCRSHQCFLTWLTLTTNLMVTTSRS